MRLNSTREHPLSIKINTADGTSPTGQTLFTTIPTSLVSSPNPPESLPTPDSSSALSMDQQIQRQDVTTLEPTDISKGTSNANINVEKPNKDHAKGRESDQSTRNSLSPSSASSFQTSDPSLSLSRMKVAEETGNDDSETATVVATKLAFPLAQDSASGANENVRENFIRSKESLPSSGTSAPQLLAKNDKDFENIQQRQQHLMLYPEWLSSGGVYPDDDTSSQAGLIQAPSYIGNGRKGNGSSGSEYYTEPEYEPLISGEGSSVSHISSHLYNFAVPSKNLPPPPPIPPLTEEEELRDEEEYKRYARLREKLADELLQDVVAAVDARRNWESGRNGKIGKHMALQEQPEGEEVTGKDERNSHNFASLYKLTSGGSNGGGGGGVVSTESPQAIIAQQSGLADVISRGRIDSVMYVYFGDKLNDYHTEEIAGRVIQVSFRIPLHRAVDVH